MFTVGAPIVTRDSARGPQALGTSFINPRIYAYQFWILLAESIPIFLVLEAETYKFIVLWNILCFLFFLYNPEQSD